MKKRFFFNDGIPFSLKIILLSGFIIRVLFLLKGGQLYYGKADFFLMGDTQAWFDSFLNLFHNGLYTSDLSIENAKFFRPPGYAFIMGITYILCFQNVSVTYSALIWLQIIFDVVSIYLVYLIAFRTSTKKSISIAASALYAFYPFIIIWVPVLYAESFSVFFLLTSFYFFTKQYSGINCFLSSFFLGLAALTRLQCLPLAGVLITVIIITGFQYKKKVIMYILTFLLGFTVSYGLWPMRNYFLHDRVIFTEDVNIGGHWSPDFLSFSKFLTSVQVDIEPQRMQIIRREKVTWPAAAILDEGDKMRLDSLSELCKYCGTGFSNFMHTRFANIPKLNQSNNCDSAIASNFEILYQKQKEKNKLNFYLGIPVLNLEKLIFKSSLSEDKSVLVKIVSKLLFSYRSLLLFLGLAGLIMAYIKKAIEPKLLLAVFLYTAGWYFYVSFIFRHLEMRYMLHADILLLFPAAYLISTLMTNFIGLFKNFNANKHKI